MTHTIKAHLAELMRAALISVVPEHADATIILERPKQASHGDFSCPLARPCDEHDPGVREGGANFVGGDSVVHCWPAVGGSLADCYPESGGLQL